MPLPKILILDIETFPFTINVWNPFGDNPLEFVNHRVVCAYSAKWHHGKHVTKIMPDWAEYEPGSRDDLNLVLDLHKLLDEADVVVAHNGIKFDLAVINARFAAHKLLPPSPYKIVDTRLVAKRAFKFGSNSQDYLCQILGIGRKMDTGGYRLWQNCLAGDTAAWNKMRRYNAHDVKLLEKLYDRLLPWVQDHPSYALFTGKTCCPKCGSAKLQSRGVARSVTREYQRFQCQACGGWTRAVRSHQRASVTNL
jgi:hypothetical protein